MIIKAICKNKMSDIDLVKFRGEINDITNLHECDTFELVSAIEDHLPPFLGTLSIRRGEYNKKPTNLPEPFDKMSIWELKDYDFFRFLGNSRIDGNPLFSVDEESVQMWYRDKRDRKITDLGI